MAYRVGIIGCGGIGIEHAKGLVGLSSAELVAGCDLNEEVLGAFAEQWAGTWNGITPYTDYHTMLDEQNLDAVTIATPDNRHADTVVAAAQAGVKAIFCEKPLCTSMADAYRMQEAVESNDVLFSVDHTRRWQPLWVHMVDQVIKGGQIGEVQYVTGTLSGGRAALFRNGTHMIDALCYLADSAPQWVFAELEKGFEDYTEYRGNGGRDPSLEPSASGYIHFRNGVRGFYTGTSKNTAGPKWKFEVTGSEGQIVIDKTALLLRAGCEAEEIAIPEGPMSGISAGVRELIEVLDAGGETSSPMSSAMNVMEVIFGFIESQRRANVRIDLPLKGGTA
jgi:UDP-N-acetyl-2-amino-2-deoxyglucuronate dehydrogenase